VESIQQIYLIDNEAALKRGGADQAESCSLPPNSPLMTLHPRT